MYPKIRFWFAIHLSWCLALCASGHAQPPDKGDVITGTVRSATKPVSGAVLSLFLNAELLQTARSGNDGKFVLATHMVAASVLVGTKYTVVAQSGDFMLATQMVMTGSRAALDIVLSPSLPLAVRVVGADGQGVAEVSIDAIGLDPSPSRLTLPQIGPAIRTVQMVSQRARTGPDGRTNLRGLPASGTVSLSVLRPGYASAIYNINAGQRTPLSLKVSRETTLTGRVLYVDTMQPFSMPGVVAKVQMWNTYKLWRQTDIAADGAFRITDIPSLGFTGEPSLGINLELGIGDDTPRTAPGLSVRYVSLGRNYNAFVTREVDGRKQWYLGYVEAGPMGMVYREGEQVQSNILLHPLARITGVIRPPGQTASVWYHDPRSINADWRVETDAAGSFEIFAPAGEVTVDVETGGKRSQVVLKGLKAHETREIVVP